MQQLRVLSLLALTGLTAMASVPRPLAAQGSFLGGRLDGTATVGGRGFLSTFDTTALAKLEEFRDLRSGPVLMRLDLRWQSPDSLYNFALGTVNSGQRDQGYWFRHSRVGRFDLQARLDETPHTYSTTAHFIGTTAAPGVYTLPTPRPDTATINASAITAPVRQRWDVARIALKLDPSEQWDMRAQYTRTRKEGERPLGMAFGGPGNNHREIEEPIQQTVHDVSLTQEISVHKLQVQAQYHLSAFVNDLQSVTADNPLAATDGVASGAAAGRSALPPNNLAQTVSITGALRLPAHTRLVAMGAYGWIRQHQAFLPATTNTRITNAVLDSIRPDLEGDVRTTYVQVSASSTPVRALSLAARFRSYDYTDQTPAITILGHVVNDRTLDTADMEPDRLSYGRRTAGVDARLRIAKPISLSGGWAWDQWRRDSLLRDNVGRLTDNAVKGGINIQPLDWGVVRAVYSQSWRRSATPYVDPDPGTLATLRRFDLAERDRNRFDLIGELTPVTEIMLSGNYGRWHDQYLQSAYGLQDDNSWAAGGGITLMPNDRVSIGGSYERERSAVREQSASRANGNLTNPTWDWVGNTLNATDTWGADLSAVIVPDKLVIGGSMQLSDATLSIGGVNPNGTPTGGTVAQNLQATAVDFPDITYRIMPISAFVRFDPMPDWSATIRFTYEKFQNTDFRSDGLHPATTQDIFLGNDYIPYGSNILTVAISYRLRPIGLDSGGTR